MHARGPDLMQRMHPVVHAHAADGISPGKVCWVTDRASSESLPMPDISKGDEEFQKLGVEFLTSREGIDMSELNELFEKVSGRMGD